ncbi:hypothetical protein MWU54_16825 [Marivita sp. S6314]|nr:hypothetical protein [Marivita sp. S6314]
MLEARSQSLGQSMTTGVVAEKSAHLRGSTIGLALLDRKSDLLQQFKTNLTEAAFVAQSQQLVLGEIQENSERLINDLALVSQQASPEAIDSLSKQASFIFKDIVNSLNSHVAGRFLFSGTSTQHAPLINGDTILLEIEAAIAGATSSSDLINSIDAWFDTGGGFETIAYQGATSGHLRFPIGDEATVSFDLRADDKAIRDILKAAALARFAQDDSTSLSASDRQDVIETARSELIASKDDIIALRADIGAKEELFSTKATGIESKLHQLSLDKNSLIGIDQYESATEFEAVQQNLDVLYRIAARQNRTSLAEYLR